MVEGISTVEEALRAAKAGDGLDAEAAQKAWEPPLRPAPEAPRDRADQPSTNPEPRPWWTPWWSSHQKARRALGSSRLLDPDGRDRRGRNPAERDEERLPASLGLHQEDAGTRRSASRPSKRQSSSIESFFADPVEFARSLAVQYGWLDERGRTPASRSRSRTSSPRTSWDASLDELVEERLASDPRIEAATEGGSRADDRRTSSTRLEGDVRGDPAPELRDSLLAEAAAAPGLRPGAAAHVPDQRSDGQAEGRRRQSDHDPAPPGHNARRRHRV